MRLLLGILAFCWLPVPVWGDMSVPGFTAVPHDLVIEVEEAYPDYSFFLQ